jgi:hypothetical protein
VNEYGSFGPGTFTPPCDIANAMQTDPTFPVKAGSKSDARWSGEFHQASATSEAPRFDPPARSPSQPTIGTPSLRTAVPVWPQALAELVLGSSAIHHIRACRQLLYWMFAIGMGARQFATRSELYSVAKALRSAEVVPGIPLGSDAPGAPAVEPPIAAGQVGAAGAAGAATGAVNVVGALTYVCVTVVVAELAAALAAVVAVAVTAASALDVETGAAEAEVDALSADDAEFEADVFATASAAVISFDLRMFLDARLLAGAATELAKVTPFVCTGSGVEDDPAPWARMTAAITALVTNTAFFNVCTPIQRLHCPPIETSAYVKPKPGAPTIATRRGDKNRASALQLGAL